jgi:hypothetical protein
MSINLLAEFYQHAYVTNDITRAKTQFADRWGVHSFVEFESALDLTTPRGIEHARLRIALAFVGQLQIELIQPLSGPGARIYQQPLPTSGYQVIWHHFAYRLPREPDAWPRFRKTVGNADYPIAIEGQVESDYGKVHFLYLDTHAELGHYSEYVWSSYDIDAMVPRN